MNFREGMRRAGLVLGIAGCIGGLILTYVQYDALTRQRESHENFQRWVSSPVIQHELSALKDAAATKPPVASNEPKARVPLSFIPDISTTKPRDFYTAAAALSGSFEGWPVKSNGIDNIQFSGNGQIYEIHFDGGSQISDIIPPSDWDYFYLVLFPPIGFFIPWGILKTITWIVMGFVKT